jgi:hypothetical protein
MKNKLAIFAAVMLGLMLWGCNKEEPMPASAKFSTNIQNNTLETKQGFTVYLENAEGEFLAYFKGDNEDTSWGTGFGIPLDRGADSLSVSAYGIEGIFTFTIVATSYGNWGETVEQDVQSIDIQVVAEE